MADLLTRFSEFHFLRPWWLLALLPTLGLIGWIMRNKNRAAGPWSKVIAPQLLPFLLAADGVVRTRHLHYWAAGAWFLMCIAAAGPTWHKIALPVHKQQRPLVILLDLSPSMLAEDIKPNRVTRARLKLADLLRLRKEGTTALVAYAADAHTVTPLTDDAATIDALLPALDPGVMPAAGSRPEAALKLGLELAMNAEHLAGDLLLVTDGVAPDAQQAVTALLDSLPNFRLSILAVGSAAGAPIPVANGGFAKDHNGAIIIAGVDHSALQALATGNNGRYASLADNDSDILFLTAPMLGKNDLDSQQLERTFDSWEDQGAWLALLVLPLLLASFRRNLIAMLLLTPCLFTTPAANALQWQDLWLRSDQQGASALADNDPQRATELFKNPGWKGTAAYRNKDYPGAAQAFAQTNDAAGYYNLGNALAAAEKPEEALAAYEHALQLNPEMEDAAFNRDIIKKLLEQQKEQQQQTPSGGQNQNEQTDGQKSDDSAEQKQQGGQDKSGQSTDDPDDQEKRVQQAEPEQSADGSKQQTNSGDSQSSKQDQPEQIDPARDKSSRAEYRQTDPSESSTQAKPTDTEQETSAEQTNTVQASLEEQMQDADKQQAMEQWLRQIPDDPSGLLRRKFEYEAQRRAYEHSSRGPSSNSVDEERW